MAIVDAESDALLELVAPDAELVRLGSGFGFVEGPVWHPRDGYLLFSDLGDDVRRRWSEPDGLAEAMRPSNRCNGMTYDLALNLVVCEHVTSSLVRERGDGTREPLATHFGGRELNSPNDVVVRSDGSIWFTDPSYGRMSRHGLERPRELGFHGVYRLSADGGEPELVVAEDEFAMPNGLCFSPDESVLYVGDTDRAHVKAFDVATDGSLSGRRLFAEGIGAGPSAGPEVVDGLKCDERGNVWVTGPQGVWVFAPRAELLGRVHVPEVVANLAWGGPGWTWLFLTASTSLYRIETLVRGRREPFMAAAAATGGAPST